MGILKNILIFVEITKLVKSSQEWPLAKEIQIKFHCKSRRLFYSLISHEQT